MINPQTNIGTILISVNPYKQLGLYTPKMMEKYATRGEADLPPHPFIIADDCYRSLFSDHQNQSILVSYVTTSFLQDLPLKEVNLAPEKLKLPKLCSNISLR
jgi:hypothetical protein